MSDLLEPSAGGGRWRRTDWRQVNCGHLFHVACFAVWRSTTARQQQQRYGSSTSPSIKCPTCNQPTTSFIRAFLDLGGDESDDLMETAASEQVTTGREEGSSESQIRGHVLEELQPGRGESPASIANSGPHQVVVSGAGQTSANGTYHQDGYFQEACKYVKLGRFDGRMQKFSLYQCLVENGTRHWYISIFSDSNPGTSSDIDFYSSPVTDACINVPPQHGWVKVPIGLEPSSTLEYVNRSNAHAG